MKTTLRIVGLAAAVALGGCASPGTHGQETPCAAVNRGIGDNAKAISRTAISRGNVDRIDIPFWMPGGKKALAAITDRQSARIATLQAEQSALRADRERQCR